MTEIKNYVLDVAKASLSSVLSRHLLYKSFKIGKTVQDLSERFGQNYEDEYNDIALLYDGGSNLYRGHNETGRDDIALLYDGGSNGA